MRNLIVFLVVIVALAFGALYAAYGEVDPCRALAVERARRAEEKTGLPVRGVVEPWSRMETSQLSTGECVGDLIDSWRRRLSHHLH